MSYKEVVYERSFRLLMLLNLSIELDGKELGRVEEHANNFFDKLMR